MLGETRDVQSSGMSDTDMEPINEINTAVKESNDMQSQKCNNNEVELLADQNITGESIEVLINGRTIPKKQIVWKTVKNKRRRGKKLSEGARTQTKK